MSELTPIYGNYHSYYNKRPFVRDPRLALLPRNYFLDARVLDVGCNEGAVTCEIAQIWGARRVIGVDIDDSLIRSAWKRRRTVWSLQRPVDATPTIATMEVHSVGTKRKRDSKCEGNLTTGLDYGTSNYFPDSVEHMFGPLPIPPQEGNPDEFPHNVVFKTADWVSQGLPDDAEGYDVVVAFSLTKWIHLNAGDAGLMQFFRRVHAVLRPSGKFVLEPQGWETYAKAKRMHPRLKANAKALKMHPDDFDEFLQQIGFSPVETLGKVGQGGFHRPVHLYSKKVPTSHLS
ncbi:Bin3-domain-containing protein [Panus rudis PR-1116 ss-1]|nr:Bin3-domain-containing protein [Panus rudis PR-1116 ss-1]